MACELWKNGGNRDSRRDPEGIVGCSLLLIVNQSAAATAVEPPAEAIKCVASSVFFSFFSSGGVDSNITTITTTFVQQRRSDDCCGRCAFREICMGNAVGHVSAYTYLFFFRAVFAVGSDQRTRWSHSSPVVS